MSRTIFALASGALPAGLAVMRISGPEAHAVAGRIVGTLPAVRRSALRQLRSPDSGDLLDHALVLRFDAPASATGEDVVELHLHGSRAVVAAVSAALIQAGAVPAEAGEFTRRALENGRIDLTQAEGLADLLAAETESQRRVALRMAEGGLRRRVEEWEARIVGMLASIEAEIEFAEDDDIPVSTDAVRARAHDMASEIEAVLANPPAERVRDGFRVVVAGAPNRGKSTLFNRLVERDAAIVSPVAGTTRDLVEASVVRFGTAFLFVDTAGLTATSDPVEQAGVERARRVTMESDLLLWLGPGEPPRSDALTVRSFADLSSIDETEVKSQIVSGLTGEGVENLWTKIAAQAKGAAPSPDGLSINTRQRHHLAQALVHLRSSVSTEDSLILGEDLRLARRSLGHLLGTSGVEPLLDVIFSQFCIGK